MYKKEINLNVTIKVSEYEKERIKEKIYEFLKELDVSKLEMEEK